MLEVWFFEKINIKFTLTILNIWNNSKIITTSIPIYFVIQFAVIFEET